MPWDCFCPRCKNGVVGSMTDDYDEMVIEMGEYAGKILQCESCKHIFHFDTGEPATTLVPKEYIEAVNMGPPCNPIFAGKFEIKTKK